MFFHRSGGGISWLLVGLGNPGNQYAATRHNMGFMSGESVGEAARFYKIPADHVLVISDDVSLPAGKLRIRGGGSAGGHNGLKNIIQHLGTDRFPRIKVGVGSPRPGEHDMVDWVMGKPMGEDRTAVEDALDRAGDAAKTLITEGIDRAMNRFN